jgi:hypothetical protein
MQTQNEMSFIKSLFDFSMTNFITMRVIRVLYILLTFLTVIIGAVAMLSGIISIFTEGPRGIAIVLLAPIGTVFYLIILRLWVEFLANLYRIGDNTQKMVKALPNE